MKHKRKHDEQVNSYVIIIAVAVAVVIGALGSFVWNNFLQPKTNNSASSQNSKTSQDDPKTLADLANGWKTYVKPDGWKTYAEKDVPFTFDYPGSWSTQLRVNNEQIIGVSGWTNDKRAGQIAMISVVSAKALQSNLPFSCEEIKKSKNVFECKEMSNKLANGYIFKIKPDTAGNPNIIGWAGIVGDRNLSVNGPLSTIDEATFKKIVQSMNTQ